MSRLRRPSGLTRDVAGLCAVILVADAANGMIAPTFSLYAQALGVSLALLGLLNTLGGLTQFVVSLPLGILSDRIGRRRVLLVGIGALTLSLLALSQASGSGLLLAGRVLGGMAVVGIFQIGAAHLGDITEREQRAFAYGLYATMMGLGYTIGPILGGQIADHAGARVAYLTGAAISILDLALAWFILRRVRPRAATGGTIPHGGIWNVRRIARHRGLMRITFGNLLINLAFSGGIITFFPIYARQMLLSQATIGTLFAVRSAVSTLGRLPQGIVSRWFGSQAVMLGALLLDTFVMLAVARTGNLTLLTVLLGIEGLAYGAYLVAGQTYLADHTTVENRGAATGVYSTASSLGGTIAPLLLGLVAERWGVATVYTVTGAILAAGTVLSFAAALLFRDEAAAELAASGIESG